MLWVNHPLLIQPSLPERARTDATDSEISTRIANLKVSGSIRARLIPIAPRLDGFEQTDVRAWTLGPSVSVRRTGKTPRRCRSGPGLADYTDRARRPLVSTHSPETTVRTSPIIRTNLRARCFGFSCVSSATELAAWSSVRLSRTANFSSVIALPMPILRARATAWPRLTEADRASLRTPGRRAAAAARDASRLSRAALMSAPR
jgi:hypothetical protein